MPRLRTPQGHTLNLPPRRVSIGESASSDIPIAPGNGLAGVHFHLQPGESGHSIEDGGSGLGTLLNGKLVTWAPLKHGDVITAGELKMMYESGDGDSRPEFPLEATVPAEVLAALPPPPPPPAAEQPPAWLPQEALLPPLTPFAQAAARREAGVQMRPQRRWRPALLLLGAALAAAAWYFFLR